MQRNVCRFSLNGYSVITQFTTLAAVEQLCCCHCTQSTYGTLKLSKVSLEKSQILSYDTVVTNEQYVNSGCLRLKSPQNVI